MSTLVRRAIRFIYEMCNSPIRLVIFGTVTLATAIAPIVAYAGDLESAITLAREYLESDSESERRRIAEQLVPFDDRTTEVIERLSLRKRNAVPKGYLPEQHFTDPELLKRRPDDLLYFRVPESYTPKRSTGLIIFLHGGGRRTERTAPKWALGMPDPDEDEGSDLGSMLDATGMITVGPSALWNPRSAYRWCLKETDQYLADVIAECKLRFNIDPNRVFLFGHSMGGFGAFHHIQRQPDRFAGVLVNAGSWSLGYWPVIRGTPICIVHGINDAVKGERWHYTDIAFARFSEKIFSELKLDFTYYEHEGEHGLSPSRKDIQRYLNTAQQLKRDAYYPHIAVASPIGFDEAYCRRVRHNRWLSIVKPRPGKIEYDELVEYTDGDDFDAWKLVHEKTEREGCVVEARLLGENRIEVQTTHIARFTIWLHPKMIDITQPVTVILNGEEQNPQRVRPSLETALDSYLRRTDWGLIYPMRLDVDVEDENSCR